MIKGFLFSKSLKQLFSIGLISCFIFLGSSFVSAGRLQTVGLQDSESIYDNNYLITFLKGGGFLSNYLGTSKSILALNSNTLFWRMWDGYPYFYYDHGQGYFSEYCSCDSLTSDSSAPSNCSCLPIDESSKTIFNNYFKNLVAGDYAFYNYSPYYLGGVNCSVNNYGFAVCFSASSIGRSLCFKQAYCYNGCQNGTYACQSFCSSFGGCGGSLENSQGYTNLSFGNIPLVDIGPAPGQFGYDGSSESNNNQGSVSSDSSNVITGDYTYKNCTYGAIINYLENLGMSRNLCYGGLDNFDLYDSSITYNPIPGSGKSLGQILSSSYNTWDTPIEWFNFWNGLRGGYVDMWSSYPAVWKTWFDIYYQYGGDMFLFDTVREYCIMKDLNLNPDSVYHGTLSSSITAKACQNIQNDNIGILDSSGNIIVGVNWEGVGNISGNKVSSPVGYMQDFFNKLKSNYPDRHDLGGGFLPVYIITFMLALILFRFLSH